MAEVDIRADVDAWLFKQQRAVSAARTSIWCSSLSRAHECLRRAVLEITHARLAKPFSERSIRIMQASKMAEFTAQSVLRECGVQTHAAGEQEKLTDGADLYPVSGKIDWRLPDGRILEMKSLGEMMWPQLCEFLDAGGDMRDAPKAYWRSWWRQVQCYLWLSGEQQAVMFFWRRDAIDVRTCVVNADKVVAEGLGLYAANIRARAIEVTREHIRTGDLMHNDVMDAVPIHPGLDENPPCHDCAMRDVCLPSKRWKMTAQFCEDDEIRRLVAESEAGKSAAKACDKAWDDAKERFQNYREANAPDANEWWLVFEDGAKFGGKRAKDGSWRLRWKSPETEED